VAHGKDQLAEAEGIDRMNIALHHLVARQPVDDVGAFPPGALDEMLFVALPADAVNEVIIQGSDL
jgi:hypothetical protein